MPHFKCLPRTDENANWSYCPNFEAAIAATVIFGLLTLAHLFMGIYYKKSFTWVLIMGAAWEALGFGFRSYSVTKQWESGPAFGAQFFVLLAPLWINAFEYMTLGRILYFFLPNTTIWKIKAQRLTLIFVLLDVGTFLVQAAGGILTNPTNSASLVQTGFHVYMGGIGAQQFFICIFVGLAFRLHQKINRHYNSRVSPNIPMSIVGDSMNELRTLRNAYHALYTLYAVLFLISFRIIYRLIEFSGGENAYLPNHEWPNYVFDSFPMAIALLILSIWHPSRFIRGEGSEFPKKTRKEKKAEKKAKKENKAMEKQARKETREMEKQAKKTAKEERKLLPTSSY